MPVIRCSTSAAVLIAECDSSLILGTWALVGVTLLLALLALFQERIRRWWSRPILTVTVNNAPPDSVRVTLRLESKAESDETKKVPCYYCSVRINNEGNDAANEVEVYARELWKKTTGKDFHLVNDFPPMNLAWAYVGGAYMRRIPRESYKHCNIAHIVNPAKRSEIPGEQRTGETLPSDKTMLSFDVIKKPHALGHLVGPGTYWLIIVVSADNCRTTVKIVQIDVTGDWYNCETTMLKDGVYLSVLDWTDECEARCKR